MISALYVQNTSSCLSPTAKLRLEFFYLPNIPKIYSAPRCSRKDFKRMDFILHTAIILKRGVFPVKKYLHTLEASAPEVNTSSCTLESHPDGTMVHFQSSCPNPQILARLFSELAQTAVLLCYTCKNDYWGYYLYENGVEKDCFCPVPDYFGAVSPDRLTQTAGNAACLAQYFNTSADALTQYLRCWSVESLPEKAYPNDQYGYYDAEQLNDFLAALHFSHQSDTEAPIPAAVPQTTPDHKDSYHFQVNLGGMLDILSNHLYKSPDVFVRELLQNGVDAITLRKKQQPSWDSGRITISVKPRKQLIFWDNGAGLTEEGIHRFLAVIGQSSKTELMNGKIPEDFIGRFGIGLLSCFMVSDSIVIHTQPAGGGPAHKWTGLPDGTYTIEPLDSALIGTTVTLTAKPGAEEYFDADTIQNLVKYYGLVLPVPVHLAGNPEPINQIPNDFSVLGRNQLLSFGSWIFGCTFLDAIPISTPHINGAAYILPYETSVSAKGQHRIYLKQMLLTENGTHILPDWAFFTQCFFNTSGLRPTASREDFYEDAALEEAREELTQAISAHFKKLQREAPERLQKIIEVHFRAIKSLSVWDNDMFHIFIDYLPFETSEGTKTGAALRKSKEITYVSSIERFRQLRPIFLAQGRLLVCSGYTSDEELILKLQHLCGLRATPLSEEGLETTLGMPSQQTLTQSDLLLRAANRSLQKFDCHVQLRGFSPSELPVLYSLHDDVRFVRQIQTAKEMSQGNIFSDALSSLLSGLEEQPLSTLYFNTNCPLIQKLSQISEEPLLESVCRILYVQALVTGGHPLQSRELQTMSQELLYLVENNLKLQGDV